MILIALQKTSVCRAAQFADRLPHRARSASPLFKREPGRLCVLPANLYRSISGRQRHNWSFRPYNIIHELKVILALRKISIPMLESGVNAKYKQNVAATKNLTKRRHFVAVRAAALPL